jgi:lipopolysaccharide export system protein LptA
VKIFCYIALLAVAGTAPSQGQVNTNTNAVEEILALVTTNAPAHKPAGPSQTVIEADGPADFTQTQHGVRVIYRDHVRVDSPNMQLSCEWLAADLSRASGRVTNIVAETNVVIDATDDKGQKMHATGDRTVYVFAVNNGVTNETVTLTGNAIAKYKDITLTGDRIIWDRANNRLSVPSNPKMVFYQTLNSSTGSTNSATAVTNPPPAVIDAPPTKTNSPPVEAHASETGTNFPPGKPEVTPKPNPPRKNF